MIKTLLVIPFFLLLSIFLISCKKISQHKIDATIYVKEYKTEKPLVNAKVVITKGRSGSGIGTSEVTTLYTDAFGKVEYNTKDADEDYMYYAEAYKDTYFDTHNQQVSVTPGVKNFSATIYMYAESYVKLHVKNVNPFNQFDLIKFNSGCYTYTFQGFIDTTFLWCDNCNCAWFANYNFSGGAFVTKDNISSNPHFSFTPPPHDTITIDINY